MPRAGSRAHELPEGLTEIHCPNCGRMGHCRRETLLVRFGPDMALPDVLVKLADCTRRRDMGDPCQVVYSKPLRAIGLQMQQ
jgi:hypothetical protein